MKKITTVLSIIFAFFCFSYAAGQPAKPSLNVVVENALFSPSAKISDGMVFIPEIQNVKKTKLWFLTIRNEKGKKAKEIIEKNTEPHKVVWDGLLSSGKIADDGIYSYKFFVKSDKGDIVVENSDLIIDTTPPFISIKVADDVYLIKQDDGQINKNISIYLSAGDENGIDFKNSSLKVLNYNDKDVKNFIFQDKIPDYVSWDGVDDVYGLPLPNGNYKIVLKVADTAGNVSQIESVISIAPMPKDAEPEKEEIVIKEEDRGLVINLSSKVLFDTDKSEVKAEAQKSLDEVSAILKVYPKNNVLIEGHTDNTGTKQRNEKLSLERAQAVFDYFAGKGIDGERMKIFGYGDTKPVVSNATDRGKEQNRRVEIVILKMESENQQTAINEVTQDSSTVKTDK